MTVKLKIDSGVHKVDLRPYYRYAPTSWFLGEAGTEPYKLLAYLAQQLPPGSKVADLGTYQGASAAAFASNPEITVVSYDLKDYLLAKPPENVHCMLGNCLDCVADYADAELVHLDIDPHDGEQERLLVRELTRQKFKGVLVCDDICLNTGMMSFWALSARLEYFPPQAKQIDATRWGHHSGTGIVVFDPETIDVEVE